MERKEDGLDHKASYKAYSRKSFIQVIHRNLVGSLFDYLKIKELLPTGGGRRRLVQFDKRGSGGVGRSKWKRSRVTGLTCDRERTRLKSQGPLGADEPPTTRVCSRCWVNWISRAII